MQNQFSYITTNEMLTLIKFNLLPIACNNVFRKEEHIDLFLNYLNKQHNNIKFTKEVETHNSLNFLDIVITKKTIIVLKHLFTENQLLPVLQ